MAFKQCRIWRWRKLNLLRRVQYIFLHFWSNMYMHVSTIHNAHKCACKFLYLSIAFKQCSIWRWWKQWKLIRRVQYKLTTISALLKQYLHACKHNAHRSACTFLYLVITFKLCRICGWWMKLNLLGRVQCILTTIFDLEQYVHACMRAQCVWTCTFVNIFQTVQWWRKLKLLGRVQYLLTPFFVLSYAVGTGLKAHSEGPKVHQTPLIGPEWRVHCARTF